IWMDVYHGQTEEFEIYIKFIKDSEEFVCTSFKEK
ncbi:MAG: type II toxin-antitoxin system MqsR family toxin, partial [Rhodobacteraceae bacterium]|nr:type II toxin-antitoxin system MqsR family toxin [Paracoccaceae bacterium]